ncbi:hypothetical protein BDN72DRAFT_779666 [Pluteus cervinus]|uniref:Uncharacterized protein n=1 Tax=Pluteus cervinus TaxID=181527 RepID=A0ACD3A3H0_9AGAR|nr:hypothetical protein BDN72DRAFT_779666 [Pluteus cervinus]
MESRGTIGEGVQVNSVGRTVRFLLVSFALDLTQVRSTPKVITDNEGRCIVIFIGGPTRDDTWRDVVKAAAATMASVRQEGVVAGLLPKDVQSHRRGEFVALPVGVSHGNGRLKPGNLYHPPERVKLIQRLLDDPSIKRITSYQSSVFSYYAPKLYAQYCRNLLRVFEHDESLQRNFKGSVFPAASFNLGPATVSIDHTDAGNVGYGLCALASLGSFDSRRGGHLILFDMGLFVEFPAGTVALLPSGILRHGNTTLQAGEERCSIAQYCAGGLLRWVQYGCQTAVSIRNSFTKAKAKEVLASLDGVHEDRVREALQLFSKVDELDSDRSEIYKDFATFLKED